MTATISLPTAIEAEEPSSSSPLRLSLSPTGPAPALLDGAWWPRSRDLMTELPTLTAVLDPLWGRITRVTVNPTHWPVVPRKVPVAGHVVKVGWFLAEQDPHELLLLSYHVGRWNLLVIPPRTDPVTAAWLMTAASDPLGTSTASRLMAEAARLRAVSEADRAVKAVWDSEGGHAARSAPDFGRAAVPAAADG
ncbi:DUF5994 family protein [Streptomyces griseorubiginosus]|uniref:Uncharacterized protein n=1 Tax=Streptomyces griseorubiginosus TaxID=67304 RepID=A0A101SDL2_9ACTN|nr:DUF5994 family protein [Streptomyces griseorubiginosus]AYC39405.1 hypothetical protein DWG14_03642 [Streptomyces griseorubiginosus]KUM77232.1 hypothetical protein AQI84_09150 [Streptomyces griseorubiginosus]KUN72185.1 hypothetical protein AQJ54_00360 [Streptomyces griseorubiginosus]